MRLTRKTTFLERSGYRRRRMGDVARVLPVIAGLLFCLPLLWERGREPGTANAAIFLFVVWAVMILLSGGLARLIARTRDEDDR